MSAELRCEIIPVTPFQQNCSLVWCTETRRAALVDAGGEVERLLARVAHHGLTLEKLLVTHGHLDHAGGVADLAERLSLPVEGPHEDDAFWIEGMPQQSKMFGFPDVETFEPERWLEDGDTVTVIKDLKVKGSSSVVKVGTKVRGIRLVEGDHDIDCRIPGIGQMGLKSQFVKKVSE